MPPPSTTATKSKDERKRAWQKGHNRSCVLKVVEQALLHPNPTSISATTTSAAASAVPQASTSSSSSMSSSTNTVIMSDAAREALVACHWAFIAEATAGMAEKYRNDGHEVYSDEDDNDNNYYDGNNDNDDKPKKKKKKKTKVGFNGTTKACLAAKLHDMGCADLWNTALSLNQAATTTQASKRGGGGLAGDAKKRKKNKALDMDVLQAEQERLLETSRLAALSQKQQEQQKQRPAAP